MSARPGTRISFSDLKVSASSQPSTPLGSPTTSANLTSQNSQAAAAPNPSASPPALSKEALALKEEDAQMITKEQTLTAAQKKKRDEVRAQVIAEIQSTEKSYVASLDALTECFIQPLKEKSQTYKHFQDISPTFIEHLCNNLETLTNFHHSFIAELVQVKPTLVHSPNDAKVVAEKVQPVVAPAAATTAAATGSKTNTAKPGSTASKTGTAKSPVGNGTTTPAAATASPTSTASPAAASSSSSSSTPAAAASPSSDVASIPAVFLRFSNFFKLYIPYLNGYQDSLNTFNSLRSHKKFQEFLQNDVKLALKSYAARTGSSELDLLSYMIQPVQRVPRYVLLLKELKRQTSPYHAEFESLNDALLKVSNVATIINEGQRTIENANKLMSIQNRIIGEFETLIQPHRRLIREGLVTATYAHGMFSTIRTRKSVFFLFSDCLLWTSEAFKFKGIIDLTPAKIIPKSSTSFVLDTANRMLQASWESEEETKSWFEATDEVICALQNEREKLRQRARVQKARNIGRTEDKDAVHKLVTSSLQGLASTSPAGATSSSNSSTVSGSPSGTLNDADAVYATETNTPSHVNGTTGRRSSGTIGKGSTLGIRAGRKWEDMLEAGDAKAKKEEERVAAFSRAGVDDGTFAPPPAETNGHDTDNSDKMASSSASPPASSSSNNGASQPAGAAGQPAAGGKYVPRFVQRRGKVGTLGRSNDGCLCTTILIHKDCPIHGEQAQALLAQQGK